MEEMYQAQLEKSSDLTGKFSILYVKFALKTFPMGFFINLMWLILLHGECFLRKKLKMPALGECDEWRATGFSVLMEV